MYYPLRLCKMIDGNRDPSDSAGTNKTLFDSNSTPKNMPVFWYGKERYDLLKDKVPPYGYGAAATDYSLGEVWPNDAFGTNHIFCVGGSGQFGDPTKPGDAGLTVMTLHAMNTDPGYSDFQSLGWYLPDGGDFNAWGVVGSLPQNIPMRFCNAVADGFNSQWPGITPQGGFALSRFRGTTNPDTDGYWQLALLWAAVDGSETIISFWRKMQTASTLDSPVGSYTFNNLAGTPGPHFVNTISGIGSFFISWQ